MITDKKELFRAIGDIDDKYITEVLAEDAKGSGKAVKVPITGRPVIKYMKYYLPAAAALLIVVLCVKSGVFSPRGTQMSADYAPSAGNGSNAAAEAASEPTAYEGKDEAMNDAEACVEADSSMDMSNTENLYGPTLSGEVAMPNPFTDCDDLAEAERVAGFEFNVPADLEPGYTAVYQAIEGKLIQVIYYDGDREVYRIRKGTDRDVSGDYNTYSVAMCVDAANWAAELKGDEEGMTNCATWVDEDGYGYSLTAGDDPLETKEVTHIIDRLMEQ